MPPPELSIPRARNTALSRFLIRVLSPTMRCSFLPAPSEPSCSAPRGRQPSRHSCAAAPPAASHQADPPCYLGSRSSSDHHHNLGDVRLDQIVKPGRLGSLFKRHPQRAALALNEVQDHRPLRFDDGLSHDLSRRTQHRADSHCPVHVHTDILGYVHWALPPWFGFCY